MHKIGQTKEKREGNLATILVTEFFKNLDVII